MAHSCPECYQVCHCGGDIDDLLLDEDDAVNRCNHCDGSDADDDDEWGCCYPGECCMPGEHMRHECHTAEDLIAHQERPAKRRDIARWRENRLRRLRCIASPTARQIERMEQLEASTPNG